MARLREARNIPQQDARFEPGQLVAQPDPIEGKAPEVLPIPKKQPRAIMIDEAIGWMDGGVLCMFREEQLVTNPIDIKRLIQHGAKYLVVSHE